LWSLISFVALFNWTHHGLSFSTLPSPCDLVSMALILVAYWFRSSDVNLVVDEISRKSYHFLDYLSAFIKDHRLSWLIPSYLMDFCFSVVLMLWFSHGAFTCSGLVTLVSPFFRFKCWLFTSLTVFCLRLSFSLSVSTWCSRIIAIGCRLCSCYLDVCLLIGTSDFYFGFLFSLIFGWLGTSFLFQISILDTFGSTARNYFYLDSFIFSKFTWIMFG